MSKVSKVSKVYTRISKVEMVIRAQAVLLPGSHRHSLLWKTTKSRGLDGRQDDVGFDIDRLMSVLAVSRCRFDGRQVEVLFGGHWVHVGFGDHQVSVYVARLFLVAGSWG